MRLVLGVLALSTALMMGGTVVRKALHIDDGPLIGWRCPHCGAGNASDPEATFRAVCRRCEHGHPWDHVVMVTGTGRLAGRPVRH